MKSKKTESDFLKIFNEFSDKYRMRDIWDDFVVMSACALSNPVDKVHYEKRENRYLRIIGKYSKQEQQLFPKLFSQVAMRLEFNPEQDFLGRIYTTLGLCDNSRKQEFTPYGICQLMAAITVENVVDVVKREGYITINDSCCGAGATLIAGVHAAKRSLREVNLNFQHHVLVAAQDIDEIVALMCYIQLSLLGVAAYIKVGNSITSPITPGDSLENYWFTPMYFSDVWVTRRMISKINDLFHEKIPEEE